MCASRMDFILFLSFSPLFLSEGEGRREKGEGRREETSVEPVVFASASLAALYWSQASGSHNRLEGGRGVTSRKLADRMLPKRK